MSKTIKRNFRDIDTEGILSRLARLPIKTWSYESQPGVRHIGPASEDFHAAFGFGADERFIGAIDVDGVALAAIQGLIKGQADLKVQLENLREELSRCRQTDDESTQRL